MIPPPPSSTLFPYTTLFRSAAVHRGVNSARVRRLAWETQVAVRVPIGEVRFGVQPANRMPGNRGELGQPLGAFFQRGLKRVFHPGLFLGGRLSVRGRSL